MELMQQILDELHDIRTDVKDLKLEMTRYKGFVGGVLWIFGALSAAVTALIGFFNKDNLL